MVNYIPAWILFPFKVGEDQTCIFLINLNGAIDFSDEKETGKETNRAWNEIKNKRFLSFKLKELAP